MTHETIEQTIKTLMAETASFNLETFKERLYCAYRIKLLGDLKDCKSAEKFKEVLANNWSLVKGNALCYTARPEDPLTELLCDIAEDISKELNITPIHVLMPNVVTESMYSEQDSAYKQYPNLTGLGLNKILQTHILSDSGRYLIPVLTLLELPGPWDETKPLPIYYDDFTENPKQHFVTEKELNRLRIHTEHTEALFAAKEDYEALLKNSGLVGHLQKLIRALNANSVSGIGTEEIAGNGTYAVLESFTQYYQSLGDIAQKIPSDLRSSLDQLIAIASDPLQYKAATVSQLCINMRHEALSNLVKKHENALMCIGVDSAQKAQLLSSAQKRFEGNKESLSKLLFHEQLIYAGQDTLGLNKALLDAFKILPEITSLRTLQDFLSLSPEEIKLIAADNASVQAGILQQFPNLESLVLFCLTTPLEPLAAIMSTMGEQLSGKLIQSLQDINICLRLMEGSRLELMVQLLANRLMSLIPDHYYVGKALFELSPEQKNTVWVTLIKSGADFCKIFDFLSVDQREAVYEALKERLPMFVKNSNDFVQLLRYRSPDQTSAICEMFKTQLTTFIQNGCDFGIVFRWLSLKQRDILYEALKAQLPSLIKNGYDLGQALEFLEPEQRSAVYEALKMQLPSLIKNGYQFGNTLKYLSPEQRNAVYEMFKAQLPTLIQNGADFGEALGYLTREQRSDVYEALKAQLPSLIKSTYEFKNALRYLSDEQSNAVYEALKAQLPSLITNDTEFVWALKYLSPEKCGTIFEVLTWQTYSIVSTKAELEKAIISLHVERRNAVLQAFDKWLATMPQNGRDLGLVLEKMSPDHFRVFCEKYKPLMHNIINDGDNFSQVIQKLNLERRTALFAALKEQLPQILKDSYNFGKALQCLSVEQCSAVCESLKTQLPTLIQNATDFINALEYLSPEQCTVVCETLKAQLPTIIKSDFDLGKVLQDLKVEQCTAVCEALKIELPAIIVNGYGLGRILEHLSPLQRIAVYDALQSQLPSLIKNGFDFARALEFLNAEQRSAVYEALKVQLPTLIRHVYDLIDVLRYLCPAQRSAVFETFKMQLPTLIKDANSFGVLHKFLSIEQRITVYEILKGQLPTFINVSYDFMSVLLYLSPGQRMEVFHLLKADLIKKIEQGVQLNNLPDMLASEECLIVIGFGANERQALQVEIRALLERANEMTNNPFCPNFENRKRTASQMQQTVEPRYDFRKRKKG